MEQRKRWLIAAAAMGLALVLGLLAWWLLRGDAAAQSYRTATIERGALQAAVSASGSVSPVTQVTVGTQVSGQIKDVLADFNTEVKAGQLIAQIDPETFEFRLRSAQADVEAAKALVLTAQANVMAAKAQVSRAQTELAEARRVHERNAMLVGQQFIAQSEADKSQALVNTSAEALKAAQAQQAVAEAQVKSAQASVAQRQAALGQARIDLGRTRITSPVNGIVIKRAIERGQTVAASLQAPELFVIAQNLRDMQVEVAIDEADVGRIRAGQSASFNVDAFPGREFEGKVAQVRKAAVNVSNVVTYVAVVTFANADGRLLPGMTANVRIVTDRREQALKLPNAALRVRIAGVEPEQVPKAGAPEQGAAAPARGGPLAAFRARLDKELGLNEAQGRQVDEIFASARPRFAPLREMDEAARGKARERILADVRAAVGALLDAGQKQRYAELVAENAARTVTRGRVHVQGEDGSVRAYNVRLGISDGSSTELLVAPGSPLAQVLGEGTQVIVGTGGSAKGGAAGRSSGSTHGPRLMY